MSDSELTLDMFRMMQVLEREVPRTNAKHASREEIALRYALRIT